MVDFQPLSSADIHPATETAQRFLASAYDSIENILEWQDSAAELANEEADDDEYPDEHMRSDLAAQDMLRSIIVFSGAGLDSAVKQVIREALPPLLQLKGEAEEKFIAFVDDLRRQPRPSRSWTRAIVSDSPRSHFIEQYVSELTGSSLQSVSQVDRAASALGIHDPALRRRVKDLRPLFAARNEIVHELDLLRPEVHGQRQRRHRDATATLMLAHGGLEVGQLIINSVVGQLVAAESSGRDRS